MTRVASALLLAVALGVSGWFVTGATAQSTQQAPYFREVNSNLIHALLDSMDGFLETLSTASTSQNAADYRPFRLVDNAGTGYATLATLDPCESGTQVKVAIDIVTATTTEIIDASASNKAYICGLTLVTAGANNVTMVEDATNTCASPDAAMLGGVTAGEGFNLAANGGFVWPAAKTAHTYSASTNVNVCLITSAAVQLSGVVKYVLAP